MTWGITVTAGDWILRANGQHVALGSLDGLTARQNPYAAYDCAQRYPGLLLWSRIRMKFNPRPTCPTTNYYRSPSLVSDSQPTLQVTGTYLCDLMLDAATGEVVAGPICWTHWLDLFCCILA
jgi:hypothetical protein